MQNQIKNILLLLCCAPALYGQTIENGLSHALALQRHACITRLSYQLSFHLPEEKTAMIAATAIVSFTLSDVLQPLQLDFRQDSASVHSIKVNGKSAAGVMQHEHLVIEQNLLIKGRNTINIGFTAGNESLNRNNEYLYALFVPDRARTVFPCFDQPDLKASFILTLTVPAGWSVLANASIKDSSAGAAETVYHFNASDKLPTYLFSFTAGKYSVADKFNMRFLYRETDTAKIRLSVDSVFQAHRDAIDFLERWTGIPFPFQKVGFAGIPSFQFGGMEHPGEVQYNAGALFLDNGATKDQLIARSSVISHETAHMWFGDMVTMKWFNDVWMKEVFANFMADKVTEKLMGQETFDLKFLLDHTPAAYNVDRTAGANPIRQQLDNLQDAGSLYGNIIYHKAPIMMRQLELLMGADNFRKGVQEYLNKYKYGNARWDDLVSILSRHTHENLVQWNQVWVNRPGRPVFSYSYKNGYIFISQKPESGLAAVWPQRFAVSIFAAGKFSTITVDMKAATIAIPVSTKPDMLLFNADGRGYGLFPAVLGTQIYDLQNPLERAASYINGYENMLAGRGIPAVELLDFLLKGTTSETTELNLRLLCGYIGSVYWNFLSPLQRAARTEAIEQTLWYAMASQSTANNKKILFKTYQEVYSSTNAAKRMFSIWQSQKAPDSVKLQEDDYTALALTIALKTDSNTTVLQDQLSRITNPDRKSRLAFLMPALSPDAAVRDNFFLSLQNISNRRHESWVTTALAYMNHPLRQLTFIKQLPMALDMLQDVQHTGDVFFPQNWLGAIFGSQQSRAAWKVVDNFLNTHPDYNPKLKAKLLQATDNLYRAQNIVTNN